MVDSTIIREKIHNTITKTASYPLLEVISQNLEKHLTLHLRNVFGRSIEIETQFKGISRFGQYFQAIEWPAMVGIFEADSYPSKGIICSDCNLVTSAVALFLGFDTPPGQIDGTPSFIDRKLMQRLLNKALQSLDDAFYNSHQDIGHINFYIRSIEVMAQFADVITHTTPCYIHKIKLTIGDQEHQGVMDFVLPIPMLSPVKRYLAQTFRGDREDEDFLWQQSIANAVRQFPIPLWGELEHFYLSVAEINRWEIGTVVDLNIKKDPVVNLVYRDPDEKVTLAQCQLGVYHKNKAMKITSENIQEFVEPIVQMLLETDIIEPANAGKKIDL